MLLGVERVAVTVAEPVHSFHARAVVGLIDHGHTLAGEFIGQFLHAAGVLPFVAELLREVVEPAVAGGLHQ